MKGLELSRAYYERFGKPMLEEQFPELLPLLAVGLVGSGSERFGFDDEISRDHDFEAGFCIFLPDEARLDRRAAFLLERAYAKLPREFEGISRGLLSPVGGNRCGPIRTADFYREKVGAPDGALDLRQWLTLPDEALAEATNGEIFFDGAGEFTAIRKKLLTMPEDIRRKRIAGNLLLMAQAGQYNYPRCLRRGEREAAALAAGEFVRAAGKLLHLLAGRYAPYYKWLFRSLRSIGEESLCATLSTILLGAPEEAKCDLIESAAAKIISRLQEQGLTRAICGDLEKHAYSVNDGILDGEVRNLHILISV